MGEIGRDRQETIYELSYCDILLIVRGYRKRNVLTYQLLRLNAYHSLFAFRKNEGNKLPHDLWPLYFDRYKQSEDNPQISEDEIAELQAEMDAINQYYAEKNNLP